MRIAVINPFAGSEAEAEEIFDIIKEPSTTYDILSMPALGRRLTKYFGLKSRVMMPFLCPASLT